MAYTDPSLMTMAQLQAEFVTLAEQVSVIDGRRRLLHGVMERRKAAAQAQAKVAAMTVDERAALKTALEAAP